MVPKLSLVVTQTLRQAIHDMNYLPLFCVFYVTDNHELILKQVGKIRKHLASQLKAHGGGNQMRWQVRN